MDTSTDSLNLRDKVFVDELPYPITSHMYEYLTWEHLYNMRLSNDDYYNILRKITPLEIPIPKKTNLCSVIFKLYIFHKNTAYPKLKNLWKKVGNTPLLLYHMSGRWTKLSLFKYNNEKLYTIIRKSTPDWVYMEPEWNYKNILKIFIRFEPKYGLDDYIYCTSSNLPFNYIKKESPQLELYCYWILSIYGYYLYLTPNRIKSDKRFLLISITPTNYEVFVTRQNPILQNYVTQRDTVITIIKSGKFVCGIPRRFREDYELIKLMAQYAPGNLDFVRKKLRDKPEIVKLVAKHSLEDLNEFYKDHKLYYKLTDDYDLVLEQVSRKNNRYLFQYASDDLRKDKTIALAALRNESAKNMEMFERYGAINYIDGSLKADKDFAIQAIVIYPGHFQYLPRNIRKDPDVMKVLLDQWFFKDIVNKMVKMQNIEDKQGFNPDFYLV